MEECQVADVPDGTGNVFYALYIVHLYMCMYITDTRNIMTFIALMSTMDEDRSSKCHTFQVFVIYRMCRAHYKKLSPPALYGKIFIYKLFFLC